MVNKITAYFLQVMRAAGQRIIADVIGEMPEIQEQNQVPIPKYSGVPFGLIQGRLIRFPAGDHRNKVIFGAAGSGKTEFAKNLVINAGGSIAYIDNADGESIDDIINCIENLDNVILLDHSNKRFPLSVGYIQPTGDIFLDDEIVNKWVTFFITNFDIDDQYMTQEVLTYACKAVFAQKRATVLDVINVIKDESYRAHILKKLSPSRYQDVFEYWGKFEQYSPAMQAQITASILRRASALFRDRYMVYTLGQIPKKPLEYRKWMDEGKIVLIKVPETLGRQAVRIIVSMHVLGFWRAALSRDNVPQNERTPFTLIADEPQTWIGKNADMIDDIFSKARKYKLSFITLFQSLKQIQKQSATLLDIILDNEPDILVFKTTNNQLQYLNITPEPDPLPPFHFYLKTREGQWVVKALPPKKPKYNHAKSFIETSRARWNKPYQQVEREIYERRSAWQNIGGQILESRKIGSRHSVNPGYNQETMKSCDSSIIIK